MKGHKVELEEGRDGRVKSKLKEKRLVMGVGVEKKLIELCRSTEGSGGADSIPSSPLMLLGPVK